MLVLGVAEYQSRSHDQGSRWCHKPCMQVMPTCPLYLLSYRALQHLFCHHDVACSFAHHRCSSCCYKQCGVWLFVCVNVACILGTKRCLCHKVGLLSGIDLRTHSSWRWKLSIKQHTGNHTLLTTTQSVPALDQLRLPSMTHNGSILGLAFMCLEQINLWHFGKYWCASIQKIMACSNYQEGRYSVSHKYV